MASSWAHEEGIRGFSQLASASRNACVLTDSWDENDITNFATVIFGIFGF